MSGNSFAIFGLGAFGTRLAEELVRAGKHVTVVDINPERVNDMREKVGEAVIADCSSEEVIREMDVAKFSAVFLGMSSCFEAQLLALALLKQEGARKVYAKAVSPIQQRILKKLGADEIILPEQDAAKRLAMRLSLDNITEFIEFKGSAIAEVRVPPELTGKSLRQLDLRSRFNINVLIINKNGGASAGAWSPDAVLEKGDMLTVFGDKSAIFKVFHLQK